MAAREPFGLSVLRGGSVTRHPAAAGQRVESVGTSENVEADDEGEGGEEATRIGFEPRLGLVCIDGKLQGNPQPRCAPYRSGIDEEVVTMHVMLDHSVLEVIVRFR
jgi:hypothetical protein